MSRLLDFYGREKLLSELNISDNDLFKPEIIEVILEKTKARQSWLIDGEGDPFIEYEDYLDRYIKKEADLASLTMKIYNKKTRYLSYMLSGIAVLVSIIALIVSIIKD